MTGKEETDIPDHEGPAEPLGGEPAEAEDSAETPEDGV